MPDILVARRQLRPHGELLEWMLAGQPT